MKSEYELEKLACTGLYAVKEVSRLLHDALCNRQEFMVNIKCGTERFMPDKPDALNLRLDGSCEIHISIKKAASSEPSAVHSSEGGIDAGASSGCPVASR